MESYDNPFPVARGIAADVVLHAAGNLLPCHGNRFPTARRTTLAVSHRAMGKGMSWRNHCFPFLSYEIPWNPMTSQEILRDSSWRIHCFHCPSYGILWGPMKSYEILWSPMESYATLWNCSRRDPRFRFLSYGIPCHPMNSCEFLRDPRESYGFGHGGIIVSISQPMKSYGILGKPMGTYAILWHCHGGITVPISYPTESYDNPFSRCTANRCGQCPSCRGRLFSWHGNRFPTAWRTTLAAIHRAMGEGLPWRSYCSRFLSDEILWDPVQCYEILWGSSWRNHCSHFPSYEIP